MKLIVFYSGEFGGRVVGNLINYSGFCISCGEACTQCRNVRPGYAENIVSLVEMPDPASLGDFIDDVEPYLPKDIPQADIALVMNIHPDILFGLLPMLKGAGVKGIVGCSEIEIEGSRDGEEWRAIPFRYKPGDPSRAPAFVAPHMPRLDWQMWFAALGSYESDPWFVAFCERLLLGSPEVTALLAQNPFPTSPPRYVRALVYDYRFTDSAARRAQGTWWRRELEGPYCPVLSLRGAPAQP